MKYCFSARQPKHFLKNADEIMVESRDFRYISDLIECFPDKTIILDVPEIDFAEMKTCILEYSKITENFICQIYNLGALDFYKENNIKFYYGYSVNSFFEVDGLIKLGVEYIKVHAPLTFYMDTLKKFDMKFRMVPNVAYDSYIPRSNGICGQWVRPEDVKYYEDGIYVFEFENVNLDQEQTMYKIYAERGAWPGNLNLLITNLNKDVDNRGILEDLGEVRANCRQRCMEGSSCHYCETAFKFEETLRKNKEYLTKLKDEN